MQNDETCPLCPEHICGQSDCCIYAHIRGTADGRLCAPCRGNSWGRARLYHAGQCGLGRGSSNKERPILLGKTFSSSRRFWAQFISASTYSGAGSLVGLLNLTPSSQRYSYLCPRSALETIHRPHTQRTNLGPADIIGH
jgi:hypothetical protein